ncbi:MAG: hypothetical protein KGI26_04820 [Thaumarchaeota archaeon]|nr:hypothetical protein [Nitrososphaerota archaeon]
MNRYAVAAALLAFTTLLASGAAAFYYGQTATQSISYRVVSSSADAWKVQVAKDDATIMGLERNITTLRQNITALKGVISSLRANSSNTAALEAQVSADQTTIAQLNGQLAALSEYAGLNHRSTLGTWHITTSGFCFASYFGPFSVYNYGGYVSLGLNGTGTGAVQATVAWDAYGTNYSQAGPVPGTYPVLPTTNLNVTVTVCGTMDLSVWAYLYT